MMKDKVELKGHVFEVLAQAAKDTGIRAYIVGGFVRDHYLGIPSDDIDVVVEGSGIDFAKYIAQNLVDAKLNYYENYGTAMVKIDGKEVEFVGARKEMYERGSRNPIVENGTLRDDQLRRDFTMNAMAFSLNEKDFGALIDPFKGMKDLKARVVRSVQDPDITFSDDPLRILRGIRLYTKLKTICGEASIEATTEAGMAKNAYRMSILTQERITEEMNKIFSYSEADSGVTMIYNLLLADKISMAGHDVLSAPFVAHYPDICRSLGEFEKLHHVDYSLIKWFFLFYLQYGVTDRSRIDGMVRSFKLPMHVADYCWKLAFLLDLFTCTDDFYGMYKYIPYKLGERWLDFFVMLSAYRSGSFFPDSTEKTIKSWVLATSKIAKDFTNWKCPLSGEEIGKELDLPEGRELGDVKKALEKAILCGEVEDTKIGSLKFIEQFKK